MTMTALVKYEAARNALREAHTIDEVKNIRDKADAVRAYAIQAKDTELVSLASEIKLRAMRRMGELLEEMAEKGERAGRGQPPKEISSPMIFLSDLDLTLNESSISQKIAAIPEEEFEAHLARTRAEHKEVTTAGVLRVIQSAEKIRALTSSNTNEWFTPARYVEAARKVLGGIDFDPASSEEANKIVRAKKYFTEETDGLTKEWPGRVWLNPPYGGLSGPFTERLVGQYASGITKAAILLVNAHSTDAAWFQPLWDRLLCFTDHRINFESPGGGKSGSTHGSVFVYFGDNREGFIREFAEFGAIVRRVHG